MPSMLSDGKNSQNSVCQFVIRCLLYDKNRYKHCQLELFNLIILHQVFFLLNLQKELVRD